MKKINIEDVKYEDFIKEDYGVVFIYNEEGNDLFKKIDDKSDYLGLTLTDYCDNDYIDYEILKVNSIKGTSTICRYNIK